MNKELALKYFAFFKYGVNCNLPFSNVFYKSGYD